MFIKTGDGKITGVILPKELTEDEKQSVAEIVEPLTQGKKNAPKVDKVSK
jgi:hypothetical protein